MNCQEIKMSHRTSRREFLQQSALAGLGVIAAESYSWAQQNQSPNEKVQFGCIGVGGKGASDTADADRLGRVVAICDVDEGQLAKAAVLYPAAKMYSDYRKMLDEMGKSIDAVTVSTPDHHHAVAASMAMQMGKHCFCQKPLTHSIWEARRLGELARKHKLATQMGNQGTAGLNLRKNAALIRAGKLGTVTEVHVWSNRPIWPQGIDRPAGSSPIPSTLNWETWIGPAPMRPFVADTYHSFKWRGWWDFGTGALGDMACHTVNLPFMALDLRNPTSVVAETSHHNKDSYPKWSKITFQFPANKVRGPIKMVWYDGGQLPPAELVDMPKMPSSGALIVGDKGKFFSQDDYGATGTYTGGIEVSEPDVPVSPGHFEEFIRAIKTGQPAMSNFPDYAGPLTETILLGNLAVWADGKKIEWDAKKLVAKNAREVSPIIHPTFRPGWAVS
jgi:predicted dehydrogenase